MRRAVRDVRLFLEGRHSDLARELRAPDAGRRRKRCASKRPPGLRDLLSTVEEMEERQKMAAANGDDADIFGCLRRAAAGGGQPLPSAQRPDRRPPRVLLGRPGGIRRTGVLLFAAAADLSRPAVRAGDDPRARGFRRSRGDGGTALRKAQSQSGDPHAAARAEEGDARPGRRPTPSTASTRVSG